MPSTWRAVVTALLLSSATIVASAQSAELPPADGAEMLKWLQAGSYRKWAKESTAHRSLGPHPTQVIAHLNATLDRSLAAKASSHPKGSAAVKELLDAGGKLAGWAVSVKTSADSDGGKGWYWYEILGTDASARVVAQANGVPLCFGCHTPGRDFVLIAHPLK